MSIFNEPFFSWKGQGERFTNVGRTFQTIGKNLVSGKIFTGVPIAPDHQSTFLGKFANILSAPATIIAAPAAVAAAAAVGIPTIIAGATSMTALKVAALGTAGYGTLKFINTGAEVFEKGGITGLVAGNASEQGTTRTFTSLALIGGLVYLMSKR